MNVNDVLIERGGVYGRFERNAEIMQELKDTVRNTPSWENMRPSMREAIDMILHKIGRSVGGNPDHIDNWVDIAGYAQLIVNELEEERILMNNVDNVRAA